MKNNGKTLQAIDPLVVVALQIISDEFDIVLLVYSEAVKCWYIKTYSISTVILLVQSYIHSDFLF